MMDYWWSPTIWSVNQKAGEDPPWSPIYSVWVPEHPQRGEIIESHMETLMGREKPEGGSR
jgi:hypothetical protein